MKIERSDAVIAREVAAAAREVFAPVELAIKYTTFLKGTRMLILWTKRKDGKYKVLARILSGRFDLYDHSYLEKAKVLGEKIEALTATSITLSLFDPEDDEIQLMESYSANPTIL